MDSDFILAIASITLGLVLGWRSDVNVGNYIKIRCLLYSSLALISLVCLICLLTDFDTFTKLSPIWFLIVSIAISLEIKVLINRYE